MKKITSLLAVAGLFMIFFASFALADTNSSTSFSSEKQFGDYPKINVTQKEFQISSQPLSAIDPIKVTDPYVTPGSPFVIEFTLTNIGNELGYPFNQISLSPDSYSLVLMADNQMDGIILPNGDKYDLWSKMNAWEQFAFAFSTSTSAVATTATGVVNGETCKYVDIWGAIPGHLQDDITKANGGKRPSALLNWSCIKLVEENYFNDKVANLCNGTIDAACLAQVNQRTYVGDSVIVALTSNVPTGTCDRLADNGFWANLPNQLTGRLNATNCGIGKNGLAPGDSVTFSFVGLVPNDTPVVSPADFTKLSQINNGITQSASCSSSDFPNSCHTIYAGVFPTAKDNLVRATIDFLNNVPKGLVALASSLYNLDFEAGKDELLATGGATPQIAGSPIYEGRGTFFVVGAALRGSITIILMLALIAGTITGASLRGRTGGGAA